MGAPAAADDKQRSPSPVPSWAREEQHDDMPVSTEYATPPAKLLRREVSVYWSNFFTVLKFCTIMSSGLVAGVNVFTIVKAHLSIMNDVRRGCAAAFALLVVGVEVESRLLLRELAILEHSYFAKGLLLAYIGVTTCVPSCSRAHARA